MKTPRETHGNSAVTARSPLGPQSQITLHIIFLEEYYGLCEHNPETATEVIPIRSHPKSHQSPDQSLRGIVRFLPGHFDYAKQLLDTDVQTVGADFLRRLWEASFS